MSPGKNFKGLNKFLDEREKKLFELLKKMRSKRKQKSSIGTLDLENVQVNLSKLETFDLKTNHGQNLAELMLKRPTYN